MKKTLPITIICGMMAAGTAFSGYGTQSLLFTPSGTIFNQNDTFTVDTTLTFAGYQSLGLSYWLETAPGTQSFFSINDRVSPLRRVALRKASLNAAHLTTTLRSRRV